MSDEESLAQYLRDISAFPLISRDEEAVLAARIRANDPEALDQLVRANLQYAASVAMKYQNKGLSLSTLINAGNLGLIRAAHKFDETREVDFASFAEWWIHQAIVADLEPEPGTRALNLRDEPYPDSSA